MATMAPSTSHHSDSGEKAFNGGSELGRNVSVQLTAEQFEELYLQPARVSRQAQSNIKTFGNPTPIGILGFILTFTPTSVALMRFGDTSAASFPAYVPIFFMMGGMLLWVGGLLEWVLSNTFAAVTFISFGAFWMVLGFLNQPIQGFAQAAGGAAAGSFTDAFGAFLVIFACYCYIMTICCIRLNVVFLIIFFTVATSALLIGIAYFNLATDAVKAAAILRAGGIFGFICSLAGWYFFTFLMMETVALPIRLPVGDLSQRFKGRSDAA